jgi:type III secretory pathway component EscU
MQQLPLPGVVNRASTSVLADVTYCIVVVVGVAVVVVVVVSISDSSSSSNSVQEILPTQNNENRVEKLNFQNFATCSFCKNEYLTENTPSPLHIPDRLNV